MEEHRHHEKENDQAVLPLNKPGEQYVEQSKDKSETQRTRQERVHASNLMYEKKTHEPFESP